MHAITVLLVRLGVAMSMFGHGFVRFPKFHAFPDKLAEQFSETILPGVLVEAFAYTLTIGEFAVGVLLLLGLFVRPAAAAGALMMAALIFGSTLLENWGSLPSQMIHLAFFAFVFQYAIADRYSLDRVLNVRKNGDYVTGRDNSSL